MSGERHDPAAEIAELDRIAAGHDQTAGFTPRLIRCRAAALARLLPPGDLLDLGCADGLLTAELAARHRRVVAVDASAVRLARTAERLREPLAAGRVVLRQALFETFEPEPGERFDAAVLSCVLEHVDDPGALLRRIVPWLAPGGRIAVIVPNATSLHRRLGVAMGLLRDLDAMGESDEALGHHRLYTRERMRAELEGAGLAVEALEGDLLKPLPNAAMAALAEPLVAGYEALGRELPELAAEIVAVAVAR